MQRMRSAKTRRKHLAIDELRWPVRLQHRLALTLVLAILAGCSPSSSKKPATDTSDKQSATTASDEATSSKSAEATASTGGDAASTLKIDATLASHAQIMERVAEYKGRVIVLDVWSTSCLPCMKEFPNLVALAKRWPEDVVCISVNVDYIGMASKQPDTYVPKVVEFLTKVSASAPNLVNLVSTEADSDVLTKFDVESMPAILVFNRSGQQVGKLTEGSAGSDGLTYAGDVVPVVEKLIEEVR